MAQERREQDAAARGAARQERTRAAILDATEAAFARTSLDAVSVAEIAERAGVSRASVFGHFGTKDDLVAAAVERIAEVAIAGMALAFDSEGTAFDRVMASGSAYLDLLVTHPALLRYLAARPLRTTTSPIDERVDVLIEGLRATFEDQIRAAVDAGQMRTLDPRQLSYFLFGAWPGAVSLMLGPPEQRLDASEIRDAVGIALGVFDRGLR